MFDSAHYETAAQGADEWVRLDLGDDLALISIEITNRNGYGDRLVGAVISLLDANCTILFTCDPISGVANRKIFNFNLANAANARFVSINGVDNQPIHLTKINMSDTILLTISPPSTSGGPRCLQ